VKEPTLTRQEIIDFCLSLPASYEDYPFDDITDPGKWTVMRHSGNTRSFALIYERGGRLCVNVKCDPEQAEMWRTMYADVTPGYHMNKTHWNTIALPGDVPAEDLWDMIRGSHALIRPKTRRNTMKFDAVGLFVRDMGPMVAFYRDVLGMRTDWNGEPNADLHADGYRLMLYGRDDFEAMTSSVLGYPTGLNGTMEVAFAVADYACVDREYARVVGLGARPVMPPTTMPWGQRTSYVADPDGNLVEIGSFTPM